MSFLGRNWKILSKYGLDVNGSLMNLLISRGKQIVGRRVGRTDSLSNSIFQTGLINACVDYAYHQFACSHALTSLALPRDERQVNAVRRVAGRKFRTANGFCVSCSRVKQQRSSHCRTRQFAIKRELRQTALICVHSTHVQ